MVLWQFTVLTVLIAGLLVYASILTRRLGCTNARLKRIEEALLVKDRPIEHADARAAEAEREVPGKEGRVDYLTIRDLRVRSERLSSPATRSSSRSSVVVPESRDELEAISEAPSSPTMPLVSGDAVATSSESRDPAETSSELLSSLDAGPANGTSVATSSESRDALETTSGRQSPPGCHPPSEDSVAKKNRDALLIMLSSQRRRRRARLGY